MVSSGGRGGVTAISSNPAYILAELPPDDAKLDRLLYVGMSRARQHLVMVVPTELARRLGRVS